MVIGCLRMSDVSVICRVFKPRRTSWKIWEVYVIECTGHGNDFELIRVETRNPWSVILVVNFRRFVIIAELCRPEVARR